MASLVSAVWFMSLDYANFVAVFMGYPIENERIAAE